MTLAIRFIPAPGHAALYVNGRSYPVSAATIDVPMPDCLAIGLDQATRLSFIGTTADRPTLNGSIAWPPSGMYDTTLAKPIFLVPGSNPASWVDITGAAA